MEELDKNAKQRFVAWLGNENTATLKQKIMAIADEFFEERQTIEEVEEIFWEAASLFMEKFENYQEYEIKSIDVFFGKPCRTVTTIDGHDRVASNVSGLLCFVGEFVRGAMNIELKVQFQPHPRFQYRKKRTVKIQP